MSRKTRSISFNTEDHFEKQMYDYSLKCSNFSGLMKRLLQEHIRSLEVTTNIVSQSPIQVVNQPIEQPIFDASLMKQFL